MEYIWISFWVLKKSHLMPAFQEIYQNFAKW